MITIGQTNILSGTDGNNGNLLVSQQVTLGQTATLQSLSFYVDVAAGSLTLGVYDSYGTGGSPGALLAQTASFIPVSGWNTRPVITPVTLSAGTYFLAYLPSSNSLTFRLGTPGTAYWTGLGYGPMTMFFGTPQGGGGVHWSFYATLTTGGTLPPVTPAPTPRPTVAPTAAPTVAPTSVPTVAPTAAPTVAPTSAPTVVPTPSPTQPPTAGANYYVSPSGSGTSCTSTAPCSLATALSVLNGLGSNSARSGKIVQLAAGDYTPVSLGAGQSGPDASHRVVFRADPNAAGAVRILGGAKVTSWAQCNSTNCSAVWNSLPLVAKSGGVGGGSHVYVANISSIGSYPVELHGEHRGWCATDCYAPACNDGSPSGPTLLLSAIPPSGYCTNGYKSGRLCPLPAILARYPNRDLAGRDQFVTSWGGRNYTGSGAVIQAIASAYASNASLFGTGINISQGAFVLNAVQELDSAGEYWIDRTSGVAYFWPWVDGDPTANGGEVVVGTSAGPILSFASGSQYVEVKGVTVEGGQTHCVGIAGTGNQLTNAVVRNCAGNNVRMGGSNNTINGGKFSNAGNDAIVYNTVNGEAVSGGVVMNAEITEWGMYKITYVRGVLIGANGLRVSNNKMYSGGGPCVAFEGKNSTIEYNDFSRCPLNGNDNGAIYAWASNPVSVGTTIRYNYFHDIPHSSNVAGAFSSPDAVIYQDDNIHGVSNYGNLLFNIGHYTGGQYDNNGFARMGTMSKGANSFQNNVLVNVDGWNWSSTMYFIGSSSTGSNNLFVNSAYGYNSSRGTDVTALPITSGSSSPTPGFANPSSNPRDLSNGTCGGAKCFTSGGFTTDPNGLNYIPWSQIGIH